jgi:uncharacterized protein (DUF697 family)
MLAFEMAVCVCDADGTTNPKEQEFLTRLRKALDLPSAAAQEVQTQAEALADAPLAVTEIPPSAQTLTKAPVTVEKVSATDAELDQMILKNAILTAGLELLPESLSTLAIIPLQMKMVYGIGRQYGFQLDQGHIKEFLATVGVGMTSQVIEGFARKLLGSFFRRAGGHTLGHMSSAATGAAVTFATTYGLGKAAQTYYASGRQLSMADLKALFARNTEEAKQLYSRYAGEVQASAKSVDVPKLISMVRGR